MENQSTLLDVRSMMFNPWLEIWIRPRKTIRRFVDTDPTRHVLLLASLAGVEGIVVFASQSSLGDQTSLPVILLLAVIVGPLLGLVNLYFSGALYSWTGSWFGGQATSREVRAAVAWSGVTSVAGLALWIPQLLLFGQELFTKQRPMIEANPYLALALWPFYFARLVLVVWGYVILVKTLTEVHRFSAWKALGAILLPLLVSEVLARC